MARPPRRCSRWALACSAAASLLLAAAPPVAGCVCRGRRRHHRPGPGLLSRGMAEPSHGPFPRAPARRCICRLLLCIPRSSHPDHQCKWMSHMKPQNAVNKNCTATLTDLASACIGRGAVFFSFSFFPFFFLSFSPLFSSFKRPTADADTNADAAAAAPGVPEWIVSTPHPNSKLRQVSLTETADELPAERVRLQKLLFCCCFAFPQGSLALFLFLYRSLARSPYLLSCLCVLV